MSETIRWEKAETQGVSHFPIDAFHKSQKRKSQYFTPVTARLILAPHLNNLVALVGRCLFCSAAIQIRPGTTGVILLFEGI